MIFGYDISHFDTIPLFSLTRRLDLSDSISVLDGKTANGDPCTTSCRRVYFFSGTVIYENCNNAILSARKNGAFFRI